MPFFLEDASDTTCLNCYGKEPLATLLLRQLSYYPELEHIRIDRTETY